MPGIVDGGSPDGCVDKCVRRAGAAVRWTGNGMWRGKGGEKELGRIWERVGKVLGCCETDYGYFGCWALFLVYAVLGGVSYRAAETGISERGHLDRGHPKR